jgi:hypothetical protein
MHHPYCPSWAALLAGCGTISSTSIVLQAASRVHVKVGLQHTHIPTWCSALPSSSLCLPLGSHCSWCRGQDTFVNTCLCDVVYLLLLPGCCVRLGSGLVFWEVRGESGGVRDLKRGSLRSIVYAGKTRDDVSIRRMACCKMLPKLHVVTTAGDAHEGCVLRCADGVWCAHAVQSGCVWHLMAAQARFEASPLSVLSRV